LKKQWIPGQARNDKNTNMRSFANCDTVWKAGIQVDRLKLFWIPAFAGMTVCFAEYFPTPQLADFHCRPMAGLISLSA
jgi:hypothetical protein